MTAQGLSQPPNTRQRFDVERQARFATTAPLSQNVVSGEFRAYAAGGQARVLHIARWKQPPMAASWLEDALTQVDRINKEAKEEGYPPITELAKRNAKHVLRMVGTSSIEPAVYPSMDGEIAVYFKSPTAASALLILLDNKGGAGCYWSVRGKSERRRHEVASKLASDFLSAQLRALGGLPLSQSVE